MTGFIFDHETAKELADDSRHGAVAAIATTALVVAIVLAICAIASSWPAAAAGWSSVHRYVHRSGQCGGGAEVMASFYSSGRRTATGEVFDSNGNTAAHRSLPFGTHVYLTNPHNGRSLTVRINDRGPFGIAVRMGAKLDLARGAARRLGMTQTAYLCMTTSYASAP
jgi:rare lipoprotein A (peptidoglycan hydrolase)